MKKHKQKLGLIFDWTLIVAVGVYISLMAGLWDGYPIGMDVMAHLTKAKLLAESWPDIDWYGGWYVGAPMFLWYSVVPYFFIVLFASLTNTYLLGIQLLSLMAIIAIPLGVYSIISKVTNRNRIAALLGALLCIATPALWSRMAMGEIPRLLATTFMVWAWYLVISFWHKGRKSYAFYLLTIVMVGMAIASHFIMTGLTTITLLILLYFLSNNLKVWWEKIESLLVPGVILSIFVTLPFIFTMGMKQVFAEGFIGSKVTHPLIDLERFFYAATSFITREDWVNNDYGASLHWAIIPLLIILLYFAIRRKDRLKKVSEEWQVMKAFFYIGLIFLVYGLAQYFGIPGSWYNTAFPPTDAFYYLSFIWPIVIGISLHFAFSKRLPEFAIFTTAALALILIICQQFPLGNIRLQEGNYRFYNKENQLTDDFDEVFTDNQYRTANNNAFVSTWFNFAIDSPQTNGYYAQGIIGGDYLYFMDQAIFAQSDNWKETKFMLDWYGIKYIIQQFPNFNFDKLKEWPRYFDLVYSNNQANENLLVEVYKYFDPKPIIEATNAPTMLVVSDDHTYQEVWHALSKTDLTSNKLIPIKGQPIIDLYDLDELNRFDLLLLHNFTYIEKEKAFELLDRYVELGGKVIVETSAVLTDTGSEYVFPPMPVTKVHPGGDYLDWDLAAFDNQISNRVNLQDFGPSTYGDAQPWGYLWAERDEVKEGAKVLLTNYDKVVMAGLIKGEGKIIWSGLNLFYHLNTYKSEDEAELLENIFQYLRDDDYEFINQAGELANSHRREIEIEEPGFYEGVLLKENYFPAWKANIMTDTYDFNADIYQAGPGMMYVDLNPNLAGTVRVKFYYFTPWYQYLAYLISGLYLGYLVSRLFIQKPKQVVVVDEFASEIKSRRKQSKKTGRRKVKKTHKKKLNFTSKRL